jgi:hypothetical protein
MDWAGNRRAYPRDCNAILICLEERTVTRTVDRGALWIMRPWGHLMSCLLNSPRPCCFPGLCWSGVLQQPLLQHRRRGLRQSFLFVFQNFRRYWHDMPPRAHLQPASKQSMDNFEMLGAVAGPVGPPGLHWGSPAGTSHVKARASGSSVRAIARARNKISPLSSPAFTLWPTSASTAKCTSGSKSGLCGSLKIRWKWTSHNLPDGRDVLGRGRHVSVDGM